MEDLGLPENGELGVIEPSPRISEEFAFSGSFQFRGFFFPCIICALLYP